MRLTMVLLLSGAAWAASAGAANLVTNDDFESGFAPDGLAQGWADNSSWADLDVRYAAETSNPHGGRFCQRIVCSRLDYGAVQLVPAAGIPLKRGAIYRVRAWLRGDAETVAVQLRQAPSPYRIYVERGLDLRDEWRELEYLWTSSEDDPEACLMLRFTRVGTVWVDDIAVEELTLEQAAALAPPARPGNLLHNGDFDLDLANWLLDHGCDYWREATLALDHDGGNPCLKLTVPAGIGVALSSDVAPVVDGRPVRIACRLRADAPAPITFTSTRCGTRANVTTEWQTVRASGGPRFGGDGCDHVSVHATGPVTLWLDDVELRQDAEGETHPRPRAAIISDRHPLALYHDGETPALRLLTSVPDGAPPVGVNWRVEDFWGHALLSGQIAAGAGRHEQRFACRDLARGWYRATATWNDGSVDCVNQCTFVRLPPAKRTGDLATSPFGAHFAVDETGLKLARAVGCRWLRLHPPNHTKWRVVEPKQGEWQWRDEPIRIARRAGLALIGSLDRCPDWASSAPPGTPDGGFYTGLGAWLPRNWGEWEEYVALTVRRYRNDIHVWEIWNEPNLADWLVGRKGQTQAQAYLELLQHTTPIVRREDPQATVIGACVAGALAGQSPARRFGEELISLGGLALMDVFSFHEYIDRSVDEVGDPLQVWLPRLREKMKAAGRELPIIDSEGGFADPGTSLTYRPVPVSSVPADRMARWLVRQYVAQLAQGVRQFYFYNFFVDGSPVTEAWEGFVEGDGQPRPNVAAYATMTWLLDGASFVGTTQPSPDVWLHRFTTPRGPLLIAWTRTGTTARAWFAGARQAWDLMGAPLAIPKDRTLTLSDAPTYVLLTR